MSSLVVTVDLDWACEAAIEETLDFLQNQKIATTVFTTHRSPIVEENMHQIEVGLHPFFSPDSSHGSTHAEVVKYVMDLPHNLAAFRCHRFEVSNTSKLAMAEAGMVISSNVCTDLEIIPPFHERLGLLEIPIFMEDGGYLWRKHPLEMYERLMQALMEPGDKILVIHPMHFCINTPVFDYMYKIKQSMTRLEWRNMTKKTLRELSWKGRGIRDLLMEVFQLVSQTAFLGEIAQKRGMKKKSENALSSK